MNLFTQISKIKQSICDFFNNIEYILIDESNQYLYFININFKGMFEKKKKKEKNNHKHKYKCVFKI